MLKTTLSSPWDEYYKQINAMFERDKEVRVVYDPEEYKIQLYVEDQDKAEALNYLLKPEKTFGNITVLIDVIPPNDLIRIFKGPENLHKIAFRENDAVSYVKTYNGAFKATYVIFSKEVVQYFNDDLSSIGRVRSTLYETIAKDIFIEVPGVYFCTNPIAPEIDYFEKYLCGDGKTYGPDC